MFVSENAAINGACERKSFAGARHADVNQATLFFDTFFFVDSATVRGNAFFHAGKKNMIEFETFGAVKSNECDSRLAFERIGIANQRCSVQKIIEGFASVGAFSYGTRKFLKIFHPSDVFGSVAIAKHGHVAGFVEDKADDIGGFFFHESLVNARDQVHECAKRTLPASGGRGDKIFHGVPEGTTVFTSGVAESFDGGFADATWRNVENPEEGDRVFWMHGQADVGQAILHFGAFVKAEAADEFEANATTAEGFFKCARLKVGAIFNGASLVGIVVEDVLQFAGDELGFGLGIASFEVTKIFPSGLLGTKGFAKAIWIVFTTAPAASRMLWVER